MLRVFIISLAPWTFHVYKQKPGTSEKIDGNLIFARAAGQFSLVSHWLMASFPGLY
jgi:hypothetical protein